MKHVKVTELRQNLPEYLARVARGERIRVTSRGKVIVEISPPSASADDDPVIEPEDWEMDR